MQRTFSFVRPFHRRVVASSTTLVDGSRQFWSTPVAQAEKKEKTLYTDVIKKIASGNEKVTQEMAKKVIDGFLEHVKASIMDGKDLTIVKFGTFKAVTLKAREGRNPSTGAPLSIPEKKTMRFAVSSVFKKTLNGEE